MGKAFACIAGAALHSAVLAAPLVAIGRLDRLADPALCLFFVLANVFFGAELLAIDFADRRAERQLNGVDRRLHRLSLVSCIVVLAIFWSGMIECALAPDSNFWRTFAGALAMAAGAALRGSAIRSLRERFTTEATRPDAAPFTRSGVYAWLRHPSEAGLLLVAAGAATLLGSAAAGLVWGVMLLPLTLLRIQLEERSLEAAFGDDYRAYRKRVSALAPFVY